MHRLVVKKSRVGLARLASFPMLREVSLAGTAVTEAGRQALVKAIPGITFAE